MSTQPHCAPAQYDLKEVFWRAFSDRFSHFHNSLRKRVETNVVKTEAWDTKHHTKQFGSKLRLCTTLALYLHACKFSGVLLGRETLA